MKPSILEAGSFREALNMGDSKLFDEFPKALRHPLRDAFLVKARFDSCVRDWEVMKAMVASLYCGIPNRVFTVLAVMGSDRDVPPPTRFRPAFEALIDGVHTISAYGTLDMAWQLGEPFDPFWSDRRMYEEHERLSKLMTRRKALEDVVQYGLEKFYALVPATEHGRLIKNSARLTLEGSRQRHCVASYDEQIKSGTCAIASMIEGGTRWTVELTCDAKGVLTIAQVKGRFNREPLPDIAARIADRMGVDAKTVRPDYRTRVRRHFAGLALEALDENHEN